MRSGDADERRMEKKVDASTPLLAEEDGGGRRAGRDVFSADELQVFVSRTVILVWLMLLQSLSSFILERYGDLVREHHQILTYCLTFLVGTGGNASAQTATSTSLRLRAFSRR